jgi:small subunit ribosomal protein S1
LFFNEKLTLLIINLSGSSVAVKYFFKKMADILDKLAEEIDKISDNKTAVTNGNTDDVSSGEEKKEKKEEAAEEPEKNSGGSPMEDLMANEEIVFPKIGDVVEGKIIEITSSAIYLDIAPFGTGIVLGREMKDGMSSGKLVVDEKVTATITDLESEDGFIELSIREASHEKAWEDLEKKMSSQEKVKTRVINANKGGLLIEVNGISGFLPVSQLSSKNYPRVEDGDKNKILGMLKKLINQELEVRVLDADKETEKLIVSEKAAQKEKDRAVISNLKVGDVVAGEVSGVVDFGAFIKFLPLDKKAEEVREEEKLEGLVHISELAWQLIENPRDIIKVGQKVKAQIIGIDEDKISLSIRALEKDPWSMIKYKVGDVVKGKVHKINHFGAFVYLNKDIHGLAHVSEMAETYPGKNIEEMIKAGEEYEWSILSIEPKDHRMGLLFEDKKLKKAGEKKEKEKTEKPEKEEEEKK